MAPPLATQLRRHYTESQPATGERRNSRLSDARARCEATASTPIGKFYGPKAVAKKKRAKKSNGNGANLGFEATLWLAADKLRKNMDAAKHKHVVLGLIFLKYISDAFAELHEQLMAERNAKRRTPTAPRKPSNVTR